MHRLCKVRRGDVDVPALRLQPSAGTRGRIGRAIAGMFGDDEAVSGRIGLEPPDDEVHLFGKAETVAAHLNERAVGNERLQLALEAVALLAPDAKGLCEVARGGRMVDLVPDERQYLFT